jgi:hypothetical protein
VQFLFKVVIYCYTLYNIIFDGKDLDIDDLMLLLDLENISIIVHFSGRKEVSEHGIVVKHGTKTKT